MEINPGNSHYRGVETLKRGFNAGTSTSTREEQWLGELAHTGLVTVMLLEHVAWDLEEGPTRQKGKDRYKRGMACNFGVGKGPWSS